MKNKQMKKLDFALKNASTETKKLAIGGLSINASKVAVKKAATSLAMAGEHFAFEKLYHDFVAKIDEAKTPSQKEELVDKLIEKIRSENEKYCELKKQAKVAQKQKE